MTIQEPDILKTPQVYQDAVFKSLERIGDLDNLPAQDRAAYGAWKTKRELNKVRAGTSEAFRKQSGQQRGFGSFVTGINDVQELAFLHRVIKNTDALARGVPVSPGEEKWFKEVMEFRNREWTIGAQAESLALDMVTHIQDFFLGGKILAKGGVKFATREALDVALETWASKRFITSMVRQGFEGAAQLATAELMKEGLGALGLPVTSGTRTVWTNDMYQQKYAIGEDDAGNLRAAIVTSSPDAAGAFYRAGMGTLIEGASERLGGHLMQIGPMQRVSAFQHMLLDRFLKKGGTVSQFATRVLKKGGYDGMMEEFLEERAGDVMSLMAKTKTWAEVAPEADQYAAELIAFAIPGMGIQATRGFKGRAIDRLVQGPDGKVTLAKPEEFVQGEIKELSQEDMETALYKEAAEGLEEKEAARAEQPVGQPAEALEAQEEASPPVEGQGTARAEDVGGKPAEAPTSGLGSEDYQAMDPAHIEHLAAREEQDVSAYEEVAASTFEQVLAVQRGEESDIRVRIISGMVNEGASLVTGEILISAEAKSPARTLFYHEAVHDLARRVGGFETTDAGLFELFRQIREVDPEGLSKGRRNHRNRWISAYLKKHGAAQMQEARAAYRKSHSRSLIREEGFATYAQDIAGYMELLTSEEGLAHLEAIAHPETGNPTLWAAIKQWIADTYKRLTGKDPKTRMAALVKELRLGPGVQTKEASAAALMLREAFDAASEGRVVEKAEAAPDAKFQTAYHGSGADFEKFEDSKIGTGEGAQAYGYGHYFTDTKEVAEHYKATVGGASQEDIEPAIGYLKRRGISVDPRAEYGYADDLDYVRLAAMYTFKPKGGGKLYQVDLAPSQDEYLLWDKPLSEQSELVREGLDTLEELWPIQFFGAESEFSTEAEAKALQDRLPGYLSRITRTGDKFSVRMHWGSDTEGGTFYKRLAQEWSGTDRGTLGDKEASAALLKAGIRGIKYLDGTSRNRPLRQVKADFLKELPEDAEFEEVVEMAESGGFSPEGTRFIKALDADGWLGFDYPAQAISAAMGKEAANFDLSQETLDAIEAMRGDSSFNYVIFDPKDVKIEARFAPAPPVDSAAFKRMVSSMSPEVKNEDGSPRLFYHGTPEPGFTKFQMGSSGIDERGTISLSSDPSTAEAYLDYEDVYDDPETARRASEIIAATKKVRAQKDALLTQFMDDKLSMDEWAAQVDALEKKHPELAQADQASSYLLRAKRTPVVSGGSVYQVYAVLENPLVVDFEGEAWDPDKQRRMRDHAKMEGYDGVIFRNIMDDPVGYMVSDTVFAFSPTQIKSATGNIGTYDPENPDIRFAPTQDPRFADTPTELSFSIEDTGEVTGEELLDKWIGERQVSDQEAESRSARHWDELREIAGKRTPQEVLAEAADATPFKRARKLDAGMHLYIDLKDAEEQGFGAVADQMESFGDAISEEQRELVELSQNLPEKVQALAEMIIAENNEIGYKGQDGDVLTNIRENYSARLWKPLDKKKPGPHTYGKFTKSTARAKARSYESILEGWSLGRELEIPGAIGAQLVASQQVTQAIHDRKLLIEGVKLGVLTLRKQQEDDAEVEHPSFTKWVHAGTAVEGKVYGAGIRIDGEGNIFQQVPLYASKDIAQSLNNMLGKSRFQGDFITFVTKWNAIFKHVMLSTGFFHHQAFLRSFVFATHGAEGFKPRKNYYAGRKAILAFEGDLRFLVKHGLTIGRIQDFSQLLSEEKTAIGRIIDKLPVAREAKNILIAIRDQQTNFLFKKLGANLKVMSALHEYHRMLKKHDSRILAGLYTRAEAAEAAAAMTNADYGGMNLQKMRRDPTKQHVARLLLLAADWTESNVQSMLAGLGLNPFEKRKIGPEESAAYRAMWVRLFVRAGLSTVMFQLLMAGMDDDEDFWSMYKRQWDEGKLRWMSVDVTPLVKKAGFDVGDKRKFASIFGHFEDPLKFVAHPLRSAKYKSSVVGSMVYESISGQDWAGRKFTTFSEFMGMDDKGLYKNTREGYYAKGDPKGGKLMGTTVSWGFGGGGPLNYDQVPSFLVNQARGVLPIPVQNAASFLMGELDAFDALSKSFGAKTSTTYPKGD